MNIPLLKRSSSSSSSKCYEEFYLDFLVYLAGLEASNLRIYNLFESVKKGEVEIEDCYKQLAQRYTFIERSVGDPHQALRILSETATYSELSKFLKDYSSVLVTSGDTRSFVEHSLKQELARYKAKISELLKTLDVLYESYLVVILVSLFFIILPVWSLAPVLGLFTIYALSIAGYFIAYKICLKLYYTIPHWVFLADIVSSTMVFLLALIPGGPLYLPIPLLTIHLALRKHVSTFVSLESDSIRAIYNAYSQVLMGRSVSTAIISSLETSNSPHYRILWLGLMVGANPRTILNGVRIPRFANKILSLVLSTLPYSSLGEAHLAHVVMFLDEVLFIRKQVREKSRFYALYSFLVASLVLATYLMLSRAPQLLSINKFTLATYGCTSLLFTSKPAIMIRDRGFTSSKTLLPILLASLMFYIGIIFVL